MSENFSTLNASPNGYAPFKQSGIAKTECDQRWEGCPVHALRAALVRESNLLQEKDTLLQELKVLHAESDHRLLNGLQMVVSLLSLQSRSANTLDAAVQLAAAANHITMIERLHRHLQGPQEFKTVELKRSLQELCHDISDLRHSGNPAQVEIVVEGCEIVLPSTTAIPMGLIANELVTNAVKHGKGRIIVSLSVGPANRYVLAVCNEGPTLSNGFDPTKGKGQGMKIMRFLIQKIGGEFSFGPGADDQGARFEVRFS